MIQGKNTAEGDSCTQFSEGCRYNFWRKLDDLGSNKVAVNWNEQNVRFSFCLLYSWMIAIRSNPWNNKTWFKQSYTSMDYRYQQHLKCQATYLILSTAERWFSTLHKWPMATVTFQ